jgi:heme exporter protein B
VNTFLLVVRRDARLALRQGSAAAMSVMFFVLAVTLFPLGVGPEANILARISAGVIWVAALFAATLSLDRLFQADFEDGSLDQLTLGPLPLELVVGAKCLAHWLTTGVPLIVASPVLAVLLIGAIGAALTVSIRRGGVLLSLLVLPLYIPVLIFGVAAVEGAVMGLGAGNALMVLGALLLGSLVLAPWASAAALRVSQE